MSKIFCKEFILPSDNLLQMIIHFYLRFSSHFGQTLFVSGNLPLLGNGDSAKAFPLQYLNEGLWYGMIEVQVTKKTGPFRYTYLLRGNNAAEVMEFKDDREIVMKDMTAESLVVYDTWNDASEIQHVFFSAPFQEVLLPQGRHRLLTRSLHTDSGGYTHEFKVKAPLLGKEEVVCLSGSGTVFNDWDEEKPILLKKEGNWWTARIDLSKAIFPLAYKYGICSARGKTFTGFETGSNRSIPAGGDTNSLTILHDGFLQVQPGNWKGAGVAIPVFSLRSKKSFGIGEFTDLKLLVDWAKKAGLKLIQLLPVNDTTATHTRRDSYPYSAISAFALHPLYINLEAVAGREGASIIKPLAKKQQQLNELPGLDYEQVMKFKRYALQELYQAQKDLFRNDEGYIDFFVQNRHWLVPYAAFCYLRDKYGTPEFSTWRSNSNFDETAIQRLVSPGQKHYDEIALHYFIQYHLYLQLKGVTEYAHRNGVIVKGDIPIGIFRYSVDAWMEPGLFHMEEQAGAPPDAFTVKGQNWGFPTYNWAAMQQDNFTWWRRRFAQMNSYFDAFRIDHILGFFRIWSIPWHSVEGIMGRFVPAIPVRINELFERRISFDHYRYTRPYITESILQNSFGDALEEVRKEFFNGYELKEAFNTQRKIETWFAALPEPRHDIKQGLFDLLSNVILFEAENAQGQEFHFRFGMQQTSSFRDLDEYSKKQLNELYLDYFFKRQDELWRREALNKLPGLKQSTQMLVCGEDLGMVPHCVPEVMKELGILSLEIQRMPKKETDEFFHPNDAPYLSVVSPSTHDMSTIRGWWEEDRAVTRHFYNIQLGRVGEPPVYCEPWINKEILLMHLYSPAMWSIFQLQDLLGMDGKLRRQDPSEERINLPSDPDHYWNYRMHLNLEDLVKQHDFNEELRGYIKSAER